ncbi:MAG TPA: hypothetical protein VG964_01500 [Candidatus Saccharimonadales bacterium]|nr:hypothetical protein [Candidatus Saccharimonadales bacterium]
MSLSKKAAVIVTGVTALVLSAISMTPALADSGQLTGGSQVLEVKNITQGGSYSDSISTACGDVVQYSTMLHNSGFGGLTNIVLKADLSAGTITATPAEGATYGTSDSTSVNVASGGSLVYQSGTTILYDQSGNVVSTLADGVTAGGVNIGNMNGSTVEYINFRAKVNCSTPAPVTFTATATATASASASASCPGQNASVSASASATATATATSTVSQADAQQQAQDQANSKAAADAKASASAKAKAQVVCKAPVVKTTAKKTTAKALPNTGPGDVAELFVGTSALGTIGHFVVSRRRR